MPNRPRHAPGLAALSFVTLLAFRAEASPEATIPAGGGLPALAVSVDADGRFLRDQVCRSGPCAVSSSSEAVPVPVGDHVIDPKTITIEPVSLGAGRHAAHVRVPLSQATTPEELAWEAILVAGAPPVFAGLTGWSRGEPGERSGTDVRLLTTPDRTIVVVGDIREDLRICGDDATLLDPRGLDPVTLALRGATLQRLSPERRDNAVAVVASPRHGAAEPALAPLLAATEASGGVARALTDGDPSTAWSEARPGRGQGEFVLMRTPFDVPITVAPTQPKADGAAPERFYLATGAGTFVVTMPEDAWSHPGEAYDIPLPEPIQTSCVSLVLEDAFTRGKARPEVSVAELAAYSAFDHPGATLTEVATALKGGGARAEAAAAVLERAGAPGLVATRAVYADLDASGRALALNIAASAGTCEVSAPLLVEALGDTDVVVREKARAKLEQPGCGREAVPALIAAVHAMSTRASTAPLLALLGREKAAPALAEVLGDGSPATRHAVRSALALATREMPDADVSALLAGASARPVEARLDLVRALEAQLARARDAADATIASLLTGSPESRVRYLLVDPSGTLAEAGDDASRARLTELVLHDPDHTVRAHAAEHATSAKDAPSVILAGLADADPRVREALLHAVAASHLAPAGPQAASLLRADPWTFVRVAAAEALGALPRADDSDKVLGEALTQLSPRVREQATLALGARGAIAYRGAIRDHLTRPKEESAVVTASARALGMLCDAQAVEALAKLALQGGSSQDAAQVSLGLVATEALGKIHPADLAARLAPLHSKSVRPDARLAADRATAAVTPCRVP